ncbi:type II restriction/modification system DNA methylase subunit YeeA [Clostridium acetobutylicum]|nr:hypothetical protein [Clostridium acetobutylicum]NYC93753.1 type II restriction/modification system DNA methylase subunit YeeA [Clostridium acetobutylicum]
MLADFFKKIDDIYNEIKKSGDIETKLKYINKFRKDLDVNYSFSEKYYNFVSMKKERGVVYTPLKISNYIIDSTISEEDIIKNPFLKNSRSCMWMWEYNNTMLYLFKKYIYKKFR